MWPRLKAIHKWCGLGLGLFLLLQAVTGLMMAHKEALTPLFHPEARIETGRPAAPLDDLLAAIAAMEPDGRLDRIVYPLEHEIAPTVRLKMPDKSMRVALVDPGTATVLSSGPIWHYPEQVADRLHNSLLIGLPGHVMLFLEGIVLTFMAISGIIIWWPRGNRFRDALTIHWTAPWRRLLRDLHLSPGIIASAFLLVSGLTGALMVADPLTIAAVSRFAPVSPPLNPRLPRTEQKIPVITAQAALEKMQARFPNGRLRQIRPFAGRALGVLFVERDATNPRDHDMVMVDLMTGKMEVILDAQTAPSGDKAIAWLLPIHSGQIYGPARPYVMTLIGLALILMTVSGALMWLVKPRRRKPS